MAVNGAGLTQQDIQKLLSDPSDNVRADIASKVADQVARRTLSDQEREIAHAILSKLVKDAAERVRDSLSQSLRYAEDIPRDVALSLARDIDSIALPFLETSPALSDDDLIEIIATGSAAKQVAVAGRPTVTDRVAQAIVETDNSDAVATLAANEGAEISEQTYGAMIERHGHVSEVTDALAHRETLPLTVSEKLITLVSGRLRSYLQQHALSDEQAEQLIQDSRERATVDLVEQAANTENVLALARQLKANDRLTPSLILRAVSTGDIRFFEASLAELSGLPLEKALILIHDGGPLGLKTIFERTGLPEIYLPAFRVAMDVFKDVQNEGGDADKTRFRTRMVERILTQYQDIEADDIDYLIKCLKENSRTQAA